MACMAAVAGASAVTATVLSSSSVSRSSSSGAASWTPLAFSSRAVRSSSAISNGRRSVRFEPLVVRATSSSEETTTPDAAKQVDELITDIKTKWEGVENKSTVAVYAGGAVVTLWLSSTIIGAVNSVPLLPKLLELVGLGYTGWFVYRYLLFKSSRKELVSDIEELKGKITGATGGITGVDE